MADIDQLKEYTINAILIDVFRFLVSQEQTTILLDKLQSANTLAMLPSGTSNEPKSPQQQSSDNQTTTNTKSAVRARTNLTIRCLDLSRIFEEKKVELYKNVTLNNMNQVLFDRILIEDYSSCQQLVSLNIPPSALNTPNLDSESVANSFNPADSQILRYLYGCYYRLQQIKSQQKFSSLQDQLTTVENLIIDQVLLYLIQPDVFPDREKRYKSDEQGGSPPLLLNLITHYLKSAAELHCDIIQRFVDTIGERGGANYDSDSFISIIKPICTRLSQLFVKISIDDPKVPELVQILRVFVQEPNMAVAFIQLNSLRIDNSVAYQNTLIGYLLSVSSLPRTSQSNCTFFQNPSRLAQSEHNFTETQIGLKLQTIGAEAHKLFHILLKMPQSRGLFLEWLGKCLYTFKDRKKLWSNQLLMATSTISVNDGFLMNLLTAMLHLCEPFVGPYKRTAENATKLDRKLLKIDPRYCKISTVPKSNQVKKPGESGAAAIEQQTKSSSNTAHFLGLCEETFFVDNVDEVASFEPQANFISECFYGTHQVMAFSFRSMYERFFKLAQNLTDLQRLFQESVASNHAHTNGIDPREIIRDKMDLAMGQFLNLKAVLIVPSRITMLLQFVVSTAAYLNHLVACSSFDEVASTTDFKTITLDTLKEKKTNKTCLKYIPEMLVENIIEYLIFLKNFNESALIQPSISLEPLMTLIIVFMGNPSLMKNPHLRARFAEILECLMPHQSSFPGSAYAGQTIGCESLFTEHPLAEEIVPSLVNVFVSIEMTGEGVQFEQKFSYRRPMYLVLKYLWGKQQHRAKLIELADEAERNIESARPPLFLRFINLLMNDAIFLLDEALGYMSTLRETQIQRGTVEWTQMSEQQRAQAEANASHVGRLARFHNVLGLSTISTLAWLTSEVKTIFSHATLVDRVANMLNYFLVHLVGPKMKNFKVKDQNEYEFEPKELVGHICQIYINLGQPDDNTKYRQFCTAVSNDGRSYSTDLLPRACDILFRTGKTSLAVEFQELAKQIHDVAIKNQLDEIPMEDIPDTFIDPIMSTLMTDPVLLPSSHIIVDRSTIARHLLSDQTDPFNRSPLSMEDVIPDSDLRAQIEVFIRDRNLFKQQQQQQQQNNEKKLAQKPE